jgi:hypothetical protein
MAHEPTPIHRFWCRRARTRASRRLGASLQYPGCRSGWDCRFARRRGSARRSDSTASSPPRSGASSMVHEHSHEPATSSLNHRAFGRIAALKAHADKRGPAPRPSLTDLARCRRTFGNAGMTSPKQVAANPAAAEQRITDAELLAPGEGLNWDLPPASVGRAKAGGLASRRASAPAIAGPARSHRPHERWLAPPRHWLSRPRCAIAEVPRRRHSRAGAESVPTPGFASVRP